MQWFTFNIQQKSGKYKRALTYDIDMRPELNDLETKKSPVKITGFSNKINLYTQEDDVMTKKSKTTFEDSQKEIPYRKIKKTAKMHL